MGTVNENKNAEFVKLTDNLLDGKHEGRRGRDVIYHGQSHSNMTLTCLRHQVHDLLLATDGDADVDTDNVRPGASDGSIHGVVARIVGV